MWWRLKGHRGPHDMAHTRSMLEKQGYMLVRARTGPRARVPTRTHRQISNSYCFFTATVFRKRASMLRYTYTACIVADCFFSFIHILSLLFPYQFLFISFFTWRYREKQRKNASEILTIYSFCSLNATIFRFIKCFTNNLQLILST